MLITSETLCGELTIDEKLKSAEFYNPSILINWVKQDPDTRTSSLTFDTVPRNLNLDSKFEQ